MGSSQKHLNPRKIRFFFIFLFFMISISLVFQNCGKFEAHKNPVALDENAVVSDENTFNEKETYTSSKNSTIPYSFMVVHCDPVSSSDGFQHDFSLLEDLVTEANKRSFKLSIHFSLSFAQYVYSEGKSNVVKGWLKNGHSFGTHSHPEWLDEKGKVNDLGWSDLPKDKVLKSIEDAAEAVNKVVGKENNKILDTVSYLFSDAGSVSDLVPDQFAMLAYGNVGHPFKIPIILERKNYKDQKREIAVFHYRGIPGFKAEEDSIDDVMTSEELIREAKTFQGQFLAPVTHPTNFSNALPTTQIVKTEILKWMDWVQLNMKSKSATEFLPKNSQIYHKNYKNNFLFTNSIKFSDDNDVQKVTLKARVHETKEGVEIVAYLSSAFRTLNEASVTPSGFFYDQKWGRLTWSSQKLEKNKITKFYFETQRSGKKGTNWHPTALNIHAFMGIKNSKGSVDYNSRRWTFGNEVGSMTAQGSRIGSFDSSPSNEIGSDQEP